MTQNYPNIPKTIHITGMSNPDTWAGLMRLLMRQKELLAGENFGGNADMTRCANIVLEFDDEAVEEIYKGIIHPAFETKSGGLQGYEREFTYYFVREQETIEEKKQFIYNYMSRFTDAPIPASNYLYQGKPIKLDIPSEYIRASGGFDQVKWLHDVIRKDGISRRHQMITWIQVVDCFTTSPPCLQRIWVEVLVPKSEWYKYLDGVPVEVHIDYRSWDVARALPSNLYGLIRMLYRYIFGNLTPDTEYVTEDGITVKLDDIVTDDKGVIRDKQGAPLHINNEGNKIDFKIVRLVCYGDNGHIYNDSYDLVKKIK